MKTLKPTYLLYWGLCALAMAMALLYQKPLFRQDFSENKKFSLRYTSMNIAKDIDDVIGIDVLLTGALPKAFELLKEELLNIFDQYQEQTNTTFNIQFIDPTKDIPNDEFEDFAKYINSLGLKSLFINVKNDDGLLQKVIFPCLIIHYKDRTVGVNMVLNQIGINPEIAVQTAIQNLEYLLSSSFKKLLVGNKPLIAFTEGHGEPDNDKLKNAFETLHNQYNILRVDLEKIPKENLHQLALLSIIKPQSAFSEEEKKKIDYFLQQGGRLLVAIDNVHAELDSLYNKGELVALPKILNLDDLFFQYGFRINYDLVADMNCSQIPIKMDVEQNESDIQLRPFLFYPLWVPQSKHIVTKDVGYIRSEFANTIDMVNSKDNIKSTALLTTSPFHFTLSTPFLLNLSIVDQVPDPEEIKKKPKPICVLLEGQFSPFYEENNNSENKQSAKIIALSDGDIFNSAYSKMNQTYYPLGFDKYTFEMHHNLPFLQNMVDYLCDEKELIPLRNKQIKLRPINKEKLKEEKQKWLLINGLMPIILTILVGMTFNYYKKKRYHQ